MKSADIQHQLLNASLNLVGKYAITASQRAFVNDDWLCEWWAAFLGHRHDTVNKVRNELQLRQQRTVLSLCTIHTTLTIIIITTIDVFF